MAGLVTAKEIARRAEVSVGTVSRVFNNHRNVSEEIRQRVLKVASELGYTRPGGQPAPAPGSGHPFLKEACFLYYQGRPDVMPLAQNPYWAPIFYGAEREASRSHLKLVYRTLIEKEQTPRQLTAELLEMRPDGLLLVGSAEYDIVKACQATGLPLVLVDHYLLDLVTQLDTVLVDNFQGARLALDYLYSLGHRQIAFIGGEPLPGPRPAYKIYSIQQRWMGYCMTLLDYNLPLDYALVETGSLSIESGYAACQRLLMRQVPFSAIFCADDVTAIGALQALREANLRVPEDVSLLGFDDIELARYVTPALTTIHVNADQLGANALRTLQARVANPDISCVTNLLSVSLVKRASVAAARNNSF